LLRREYEWLGNRAKLVNLCCISSAVCYCRFVRNGRVFLLLFVTQLLAAIPALSMDRVRQETGVDAAVLKYGVTGSNVLVAILDRGIDWKHPDFRNADGSTRIEFIYDLTDNSGSNAPGNIFGVGTIYSKAQINGALSLSTNLNTRDAIGHGTTSTGIACGNGRGNALYRGIAPGAKIIAVKLVSDGAPAHDSEPAEAAFYDPSLIPAAIDFVTNKAAALGLPCVMFLNIGSVIGPTDGTSRLARKIDATVGAGKPGLVFVTGTSDDGGATNRVGGALTNGGSVQIQIQKEVSGSLYFDLWYQESDRFNVRIFTPTAGTFGPYTAPASPAAYDVQSTAQFLYYHLGRDMDFFEAANSKRELWIRLDGAVGLYRIELFGASVVDGRFDATLNPSRFDSSGSPVSRFLNFAAPGSIWDGAAASNNVCPNSYVIRTNYTDIDGIPRTLNQGVVGDLWKGSGVGPTFDGRLGVDVSAPADALITTYNPKSWWATFRFNLIQGGNTNYGLASAVSAANPIVTGIILLLLEMDPTLDAVQIRDYLRQTAKTDALTGTVPNTSWGYGKVNALGALDLLHNDLTRLRFTMPDSSTLRLTARGQPGKTYRLEETTNFTAWVTVATNVAGTNSFLFDRTIVATPKFYRLAR
jgi:minor extracellular serine protease Vpr